MSEKAAPLTPEELKAIKARCETATLGPWSREKPPYIDGWPQGSVIGGTVGKQTIYTHATGGTYPNADATFIAHSREDVGRLLATIAEQAETIARLQQIEERAKAEMEYNARRDDAEVDACWQTASYILEGEKP